MEGNNPKDGDRPQPINVGSVITHPVMHSGSVRTVYNLGARLENTLRRDFGFVAKMIHTSDVDMRAAGPAARSRVPLGHQRRALSGALGVRVAHVARAFFWALAHGLWLVPRIGATLPVPNNPRRRTHARLRRTRVRGQVLAVIDSEPVQAPQGETRGNDAGKKIVGRKRHIAVD